MQPKSQYDTGQQPAGIFLQLQTTGVPDFAAIRHIVTEAETIGITAVLFVEGAGALEPLTLLAALAPLTRSIGLVAEIAPLETPPYTAARRLAAVDHVSGGRTGWLLCTDIAADRQADYVTAVQAMWDSWDDHVHRFDKATGVYIDTTGIRAANHAGPFYRVAGPLDIPRPPQGILPRFSMNDAADVHIQQGVGDAPARLLIADALIGELIPVTADLACWDQVRSSFVQRLAGVASAVPIQTLRQRLGLGQVPVHAIHRTTES